LVHWKEFLDRYPDAPESSELERRVKFAESEWLRTQHKKSLTSARRALDRDQFRLALIYADRALGYVPEDAAAEEVRDEAAGRLRRSRADRARSTSSASATTSRRCARERSRWLSHSPMATLSEPPASCTPKNPTARSLTKRSLQWRWPAAKRAPRM
jgi:hypothetical protein